MLDENNRELPVRETGEICIRGDILMTEYLHNPEATRKSIVGEWLHTGDMGTWTKTDISISLTGRKT